MGKPRVFLRSRLGCVGCSVPIGCVALVLVAVIVGWTL